MFRPARWLLRLALWTTLPAPSGVVVIILRMDRYDMLPRVNIVRGDQADYMLFSTRDAISSAIYSNGAWAAPLLNISKLFYDDVAAPLIVDIGANLGAYAIPIAKSVAAQSGSVYAFEPQRIVYYQLCGNAFLNRLDNLFAYNMAIGDRDGSQLIPSIDYEKSMNIGGFSLDQQSNQRRGAVALKPAEQSAEVVIARLDSLTLPKAPALIKIDVEGMELEVLQGARGMLESHDFPPLLLEAWNLDWFKEKRQALLDLLGALGYEYFQISDELFAQHPKFSRQIKFHANGDGVVQVNRVR